MGKAEQNKQEKNERLLSAGFKLFAQKGVDETSVSEICEHSNIAKGTFYLYYPNKEALARAVSLQLSMNLFRDALVYIEPHRTEDFTENMVMMSEYLIDRLQQDPDVLEIMRKNYIMPVDVDVLLQSEHPDIRPVMRAFRIQAKQRHITTKTLTLRVVSLISMVLMICYSCIKYNVPTDINTLKPVIYDMVRATLKEEE